MTYILDSRIAELLDELNSQRTECLKALAQAAELELKYQNQQQQYCLFIPNRSSSANYFPQTSGTRKSSPKTTSGDGFTSSSGKTVIRAQLFHPFG